MPKIIKKYATGDEVPEGAEFMQTVVQTTIRNNQGGYSDCFEAIHHFLVEVKE